MLNNQVKTLLNLHKTQLLISVTSLDEAQIALENGADLIDLKDPHAGALGALPINVVQSVVTYVKRTNAKKMTSATVGDVPMQADLLRDSVSKMLASKVDYIKIGFFDAEGYQGCLNALSHFAKLDAKLIAVLFAEKSYPSNLIEAIKQAGFVGVMLDTAEKNGRSLLTNVDEKMLLTFAQKVADNALIFGLAGSLKSQHVAQLLKLNPTYLGFRGGVCESDLRTSFIRPEKIWQIKQMLMQ
ncbi:MAG TPA: (5-formylfuran-3-yl)methyl phosphate synthase [Methylotenera sp.]|nr:(5-formylfuran-3-yl)methyl phosphate synthase [Methylotenera sp.]HPH04515.1 (5-formylfuran-3-yl)methyl phosphate synthase [Methylotenera sp.]HPN01179.1 (5-formylfuran-3-yl)methyl phosphate synthase [Methylotenera sp.]